MRALLLSSILIFLPGVAAADEREQLREVERALDAGTSRAAELQSDAAQIDGRAEALRRKTIAVARTAQEEEAALSEIEQTLIALGEEEEAISARLEERRRQVSESLMALQRLGLHPPDSLVAVRASPTDTVRTALLLRAAVPILRSDVAEMGGHIERLAEVREETTANRAAYETRLAALETEQTELTRLLDELAALSAKTRKESDALSQRNAALADKAKNLQELVRQLEKSRAAPAVPVMKPARIAVPTIRDFVAAKGTIGLPARGPIARNYGESQAFGQISRGIVIETRAGAQVVAPYDGKIAFAGPFRDYGQILIIEHSGGYHSLLAGLGRIGGVTGQWVIAGEPLGEMGHPESGKSPLYFELRRNGQPINPSPWLATLEDKDNG